MTPTQEDTGTRPARRFPLSALLLTALPVAVVATTGAAAGAWQGNSVVEAGSADAVAQAVTTADASIESVTAGSDALGADYGVAVPQISVSLPPEPVVTPAPVAADNTGGNTSTGGSGNTSAGTSGGSTSSGSTKSAPATQSYTSYCASPSSPFSASSPQGMLAAANQERARLGIAPLSWSGSLASAATSWSQTMAAEDSQTDALIDAMRHNPNRPAGGENVAVSYASRGHSQSAAAAKAHYEWMYSNGHCLNIMNPAWSVMGAGMAVTADGNTWYSTVNFQ